MAKSQFFRSLRFWRTPSGESTSTSRLAKSSKNAGKAKLIVGLGNPGKEYQGTRHNVGFSTIDTLARRHKIHVKARRNRAMVGEGFINGEKVILAKPLTFMNRSGEAVGGLARRYRINDLSNVIIIYDDINLPLGRLRIRPKGSAGGHNGLESVIHSLHSEDFPRIRIGIGSPRRDMVKHVLSKFSKAEREIANEAIDQAADAVETILNESLEQAMNIFNPSK